MSSTFIYIIKSLFNHYCICAQQIEDLTQELLSLETASPHEISTLIESYHKQACTQLFYFYLIFKMCAIQSHFLCKIHLEYAVFL